MTDLESVCVKIFVGSKQIYLYCLYIQPTASDNIYRSHVRAISNLSMGINSTLIILGDFNLPNVRWEENDCGFGFLPIVGDANDRKSLIARATTTECIEVGLTQICNFENKWHNVLDLVYTNEPESMMIANVEIPLIPPMKRDPAHVPIMCKLKCETTDSSPRQKTHLRFCFRKADYNVIRNNLMSLKLNEKIAECGDDVDLMLSSFYAMMNDVFEKFVPTKTYNPDAAYKPQWYDKKLSRLKNVRNKSYKKLCRERTTGGNANEEPFLDATKQFVDHRTKCYSDFVRDLSSRAKNDPKSFWQHINSKRSTKNSGVRRSTSNDR